jgi:demethylmenaquinone methyltransferase / 2-methoxy-6-polyprenyl-1,4-benzoquinol methylase
MIQPPSRHDIWRVFDEISPTYDRVNRILSYGIDRYWRKKLTSFVSQQEPIRLLDLATGTADQIIAFMESALQITEAVGIDLAPKMLEIGQRKLAKKIYRNRVRLQEANALEIPFEGESFDCATMSFGIRNVTSVPACLREIVRILKRGGLSLILEATLPQNRALQPLYLLYLRHLLPHIGGWMARKKEAYIYLNQTIETFPSGEAFCQLMSQAGFSQVTHHPLTAGIVTIYRGIK